MAIDTVLFKAKLVSYRVRNGSYQIDIEKDQT